MNNIEDAIKRCKELIKPEHSNWIGLTNQSAIKIVLGNLEALCDMQKSADRELENARRINEEHKKENGELRAKVKELEEELYSANKIVEEYLDGIPKQKIKELKENIHNIMDKNGMTRAYQIVIDEQFKELLQENEDK